MHWNPKEIQENTHSRTEKACSLIPRWSRKYRTQARFGGGEESDARQITDGEPPDEEMLSSIERNDWHCDADESTGLALAGTVSCARLAGSEWLLH